MVKLSICRKEMRLADNASVPNRRLEGIIDLPHPLFVNESVFAQVFPFRLPHFQGRIWFPTYVPDAATADKLLDCPLAEVPRLGELADVHWAGPVVLEYTVRPDDDDLRALPTVQAVAFRATPTVEPTAVAEDRVHDFGSEFDLWFERFEQWIHVWAPDAVRRASTTDGPVTSGEYWLTSNDRAVRSGWGPFNRYDALPSASGLNRTELASAFARASREETLPTAWLFLLRARQAHDPRTAVIEAATAVEVALGGCLHDRLAGLTLAARERIVLEANGLTGLLRLLEATEGRTKSSWKRVADRLANPRNAAVHAGVAPMDVEAALAEAAALLDEYAPLPHPEAAAE